MTRQRAYIAPVRRLPNEILSEIFLWSSRGERFSSYRCVPMVISQVCKLWRDLIYELPKAWSYLEYRSFFSSTEAYARRMMHRCLQNSKGLPFPHEVDVSSFSEDWRAFNVLVQYSDQWTSLVIKSWARLPIWNDLKDRSFSQLHRLECDASHVTDDRAKDILESRAPLLRSVKLSNISTPTVMEMPHLPWSQLTDIELDCL